ncbi:lactonase family protein [Xylophilus sp.]|uniref:lactonase family protein n=1 Tax=Xylophilus sp. TaxID=2653893 RepID=UPI0013BDC2B4|nr:beta-propeller fold lactonase family protein [Xylophilus sp.]KAF1047515.1 MAG: 6-phosphogluconolactonase [Xylophilus sp.]
MAVLRSIAEPPRHLLVGGFTTPERDGRAQGVQLLRLAGDGGAAAPVAALALTNPSYFARHPRLAHRFYVGHSDAGEVSAIDVDTVAGRIELRGTQATDGRNVAHLACAPDGSAVVAACFGSGQVTAFPLSPGGDLLAPSSTLQLEAAAGPRRSQPHCQPHQISFSPDGRHLLAPDRGTDGIWVLALKRPEATLSLAGRAVAWPGAGPRHVAWHARLPLAYVANELDSTVAIYRWDAATATLSPAAAFDTLAPQCFVRNISAAIRLSPDGRRLYVSQRGADAISVMEVADDGLSLRLLHWQEGVGHMPRHMAFAEGGRSLWVASHGADLVQSFGIDAASGALRPSLPISTPSPACVLPL